MFENQSHFHSPDEPPLHEEAGVESSRWDIPLENRKDLNGAALDHLIRLRELYLSDPNRGWGGMKDELSDEEDKIIDWFWAATSLTKTKAARYDWDKDFGQTSYEVDPELARFYLKRVLNPIKERMERELSPARESLKKAIDERGITVQGVGKPGEELVASDTDGNVALRVLITAGLVDQDTKINFVTHREFEEGKGQDAAVIIDIAKGDYAVSSAVKADVSRELKNRVGQEPTDDQGNPKPAYLPIDRDHVSHVFDHHGPDSGPNSGSATRKVYDMVVALGFLDADSMDILEPVVAAVDALDDKTYLKKTFKYDVKSLAGLQRALVKSAGGTKEKLRPLSFITDKENHDLDKRYKQLLEASDGNAIKHLSDEELQRIGLLEVANKLDKQLAPARARLVELKKEGKGFVETGSGEYIAIDENDRALKDSVFSGLDEADLLFESGVKTRIARSTADQPRGKSIFVNSQDHPEILQELQARFGGYLVREKMWGLNDPDAIYPTDQEILEIIGRTYGGVIQPIIDFPQKTNEVQPAGEGTFGGEANPDLRLVESTEGAYSVRAEDQKDPAWWDKKGKMENAERVRRNLANMHRQYVPKTAKLEEGVMHLTTDVSDLALSKLKASAKYWWNVKPSQVGETHGRNNFEDNLFNARVNGFEDQLDKRVDKKLREAGAGPREQIKAREEESLLKEYQNRMVIETILLTEQADLMRKGDEEYLAALDANIKTLKAQKLDGEFATVRGRISEKAREKAIKNLEALKARASIKLMDMAYDLNSPTSIFKDMWGSVQDARAEWYVLNPDKVSNRTETGEKGRRLDRLGDYQYISGWAKDMAGELFESSLGDYGIAGAESTKTLAAKIIDIVEHPTLAGISPELRAAADKVNGAYKLLKNDFDALQKLRGEPVTIENARKFTQIYDRILESGWNMRPTTEEFIRQVKKNEAQPPATNNNQRRPAA